MKPLLGLARIVLGVLGLGAPLLAQVKLPALISDHMVLQRHDEVTLWGWAAPSEEVTLTLDWQKEKVVTRADTLGNWRMKVKTPDAGGPFELVFRASNTVEVKDVLVGEVWLCSGQSNMEMALGDAGVSYGGASGWESEVERSELPTLRLFDVKNQISTTPATDVQGSWKPSRPEVAKRFSAAGFFFGRKLHADLGVPVGLVSSDWGGTVVESWTSARGLRAFPEFAPDLTRIAELANTNEQAADELAGERAAWWERVERIDRGLASGFASRHGDHGSWSRLEVPGVWDDRPGLVGFDGVVWFRKSVDIPRAWRGQDLLLNLGAVDDMDTVWVNGVRVGGEEAPGAWRKLRRYDVPAAAVGEGMVVIAVRAVDTGGAGGFTGPLEELGLAPSKQSTERISLAGPWSVQRGAAMARLGPIPSRPSFHANSPTALFNGMIAPLLPFAFRGAIWYQGESNRQRALQYRTLFPAMISDWRSHWERGDFPFYYVQIAPFGYGDDVGEAAELREAQFLTLEAVPNVGMAVTMDVGNPKDIHPKKKRQVGERLARWALHQTYGRRDLVPSGPLYRGMEVDGGTIRIAFDHVGGGLVAEGGGITCLTVAGEDGKFVPAKGNLDGDTLVVSSPLVLEPRAVRYGFGAADAPNLFNREGLPASSFRTDDLPRSLVMPKR